MPDDTKQAGRVEATGANGAAEDGRKPPQVKAPDGIPQEQFDAMRFIYDNWESGIFRPYVDQYIAVYRGKVLGSDTHPWRLLNRVATENGIDPTHIAIKFVD
jgi:hypothetical protein